MKPERWLQIEDLCQAALDRTEEQRASFLDSRCAGDKALRLEVESLLRYQEPANNFIETPALEVAAKLAAADQAPRLVNQQMSHYRTLSLVGAGGMGKVYLAEDINLNRRIALKLLPSEFTRNASRVRRFKQEARALSALNHPNIVTIHEIGAVEETHYIATEFVDGQTVRQQINNEMISLRDAIEVASQVASALVVAHDAGVVHRDIKPENIMVRKDGLVKVLDFGLAKLAEAEAEAEADEFDTSALKNEAVSTETGALMGTVRYMSPEQARGLTLDARSDIFSLGVVLYEMLSGKSPFAGATTADVIAAISDKEPPPITQYRPEAPDELKRILTLSLQKDRAERYQTAREILTDLKRVKQRLEIEAELKSNSATSGGLDHVTTAEGNAVEAAAPPMISAEGLRPVERYGKTKPVSGASPRTRTAATRKLTAVMATLVLVFITMWMFLRNRPGAPASVAAIRSLAILPLENLSHDPEQEFFADGMTDALITNLAQINSLKVISRDSVMRYKGTRKPLPDIAKELNVDGIVEGSVMRSGERVRVDAQLIEARTDRHFWAKTYERNLSDVITLQNEVAHAIANEIQVKLTPGEQARLLRTESVDPQAHEFYLKGLYFWNQRSTAWFHKSIDYFQQAIERDPQYALAYASMAGAYLSDFNSELSKEEKCLKAGPIVRTALQMDEGLGEARAVLAWDLFICDWDWAGAEREFQRAIALNPNYAWAHNWYGNLLHALGRQNWSAEVKRARELDPLSLIIGAGDWYVESGQYDLYIEYVRKRVELNPNYAGAYESLARGYTLKGMYPEAIVNAQKAVDLSGGSATSLTRLAYVYAVANKRKEALKILDQKILLSKRVRMRPFNIALVYVGLGEKDRAFDWLQKALADRSIWFPSVRSKELDSIRSDPRYVELMSGVGLPP
jgi:serine/threonine-protein kinase